MDKKFCANCQDEIEQYSEFDNPKGKGFYDLKCYAAFMDGQPLPTAAEVKAAFAKAVNV